MNPIVQPQLEWYLAPCSSVGQPELSGGVPQASAARPYAIGYRDEYRMFNQGGAGNITPPWSGQSPSSSDVAEAMCWAGDQYAAYVVTRSITAGVVTARHLWKCDEFFTSAVLIEEDWQPFSLGGSEVAHINFIDNIPGEGLCIAYHVENTTSGNVFYYAIACNYDGSALAPTQDQLLPGGGISYDDIVLHSITSNRSGRNILGATSANEAYIFAMVETIFDVGDPDQGHTFSITGTDGSTSNGMTTVSWDIDEDERFYFFNVTYDREGDRLLFPYLALDVSTPPDVLITASELRQITRDGGVGLWTFANTTTAKVCDLPAPTWDFDFPGETYPSGHNNTVWRPYGQNKLFLIRSNFIWGHGSTDDVGIFQMDLDGGNVEKISNWRDYEDIDLARVHFALGPGTRPRWEL